MVKLSQFFNGSYSTLQARSQHFMKVWLEFTPPSKMVMLTPKSSILNFFFWNSKLDWQILNAIPIQRCWKKYCNSITFLADFKWKYFQFKKYYDANFCQKAIHCADGTGIISSMWNAATWHFCKSFIINIFSKENLKKETSVNKLILGFCFQMFLTATNEFLTPQKWSVTNF